jgi:hypothetical protein
LTSEELRNVCGLLYLSTVGSDVVLQAKINTKLNGVLDVQESQRLVSPQVAQALGRL